MKPSGKVSPEARRAAFLEFSALADRIGAVAASEQRPDLYHLMQGKPAPAVVHQFKGKGPTNKDRSRRPSPWSRWIPEAEAWLHVPPSQEELAELASGREPSDELALAEAQRRLDAGDDPEAA